MDKVKSITNDVRHMHIERVLLASCFASLILVSVTSISKLIEISINSIVSINNPIAKQALATTCTLFFTLALMIIVYTRFHLVYKNNTLIMQSAV